MCISVCLNIQCPKTFLSLMFSVHQSTTSQQTVICMAYGNMK